MRESVEYILIGSTYWISISARGTRAMICVSVDALTPPHRVESQINYKLYDCVKRLPFSFWENSFCNVWTGLCRHTRTILNNKFPHTADIIFNDRFCSDSRTLHANKKEKIKKNSNIIQSLWWWLRIASVRIVCPSSLRFYWRHLNKFIFADKSRSTNLIYFLRLFTLCFCSRRQCRPNVVASPDRHSFDFSSSPFFLSAGRR